MCVHQQAIYSHVAVLESYNIIIVVYMYNIARGSAIMSAPPPRTLQRVFRLPYKEVKRMP